MATAEPVKALIRGPAGGDHLRFCALAMQGAAQAVRRGPAKFDRKGGRELVDRAKGRATAEPAPSGLAGETGARLRRAYVGLLDTLVIDRNNPAKAAERLNHAEIAMTCEQAPRNAMLVRSTVVRDSERAGSRLEEQWGGQQGAAG